MTPTNENELAEAIKGASGPLRIVGGGTRPIGNPVEGEVLSTAGLSGITLYEPGALTLVAQAGTPLAEIEAALDAENQRLAFEPMDHRTLLGTTGEPTIGGIVAANVSGPRRISVGACRDHMLGVRFVDGQGIITKNGGRVMKNVTGYDLVKLMTGSYGVLGVLSEVSLKVLPKPEASATLTWSGLGWTAASRVFASALGSPYEVTGAARLPEDTKTGALPRTMIRIEGFEKSVKYRSEQLSKLLPELEPDHIKTEPKWNEDAWRYVRDVLSFKTFEGDVWRTSVKPSDMIKVTGQSQFQHVVDWGGGLIWTCVPYGTDFRATLGQFSGHATLVRASAETRAQLPAFQLENDTVTMLSKGLRAKFDPRGILNAGLMG